MVSLALVGRTTAVLSPGLNACCTGRASHVRIPNSYPGGRRRRFAGAVPRSHLLRAQRSGGGGLLLFGVLLPNLTAATRHPGQHRPHWNVTVSRSGELGAGWQETGLTEPPQRDEQLAGQRHKHDPADAPSCSDSALDEMERAGILPGRRSAILPRSLPCRPPISSRLSARVSGAFCPLTAPFSPCSRSSSPSRPP